MITEQQLRSIPLLSSLSSEELGKLASVLRVKRAPKGSYILYVEDPGPCLMFLSKGKVKVTLVSQEGKEIVLAHLNEGEFFGEVAILTGEDRSANVVALTDCESFVISKEDFENHILNNFGLAHAMLRELAFRLRSASSKIGDLALFDVYRRVARTLQSSGKVIAKEGGKRLVIENRPTHQELASMVGTSREMVTRALKGLEEDGCIVIEGKRIEIIRMPL